MRKKHPDGCKRRKMIEITQIGPKWTEKKGFYLSRTEDKEYVFVHFITSALIDGKMYPENTFVLYDAGKTRIFSSPAKAAS